MSQAHFWNGESIGEMRTASCKAMEKDEGPGDATGRDESLDCGVRFLVMWLYQNHLKNLLKKYRFLVPTNPLPPSEKIFWVWDQISVIVMHGSLRKHFSGN